MTRYRLGLGVAFVLSSAWHPTPLDVAVRLVPDRVLSHTTSLDGLPWPERIALERAMAEHDPAHRPQLVDGVPTLAGVSFDQARAVVSVGSPDASITVSLAALGRQGALRALDDTPRARIAGPEVRATRAPGIVEWWRSLPSGLEHGITIAERPSGVGTLVLEVAVGGDARPERGGEDEVVFREADGDRTLATYAHLVVLDSTGTRVPAELGVRDGLVRIEISDDEARYPLVVDPLLVTEEASLVSSGAERDDRFGYAVALSGDGLRAIVGASEHTTTAGGRAGTAWVFVRGGAGWAIEATLVPSSAAADDFFASAVALSADGTRAIVGTPGDDTVAGANAGSVSVYLRTGSVWALEATLLSPGGAANDEFGASVGLSDDGTRVVLGRRSARVFVRTGTTWAQESNLALDAASVAISGDGLRVLVGVTNDGFSRGTVHVLRRSGSTWTMEARLDMPGGVADEDLFGCAVALSTDGSRALVGARGDDTVVGFSTGSAHLFFRTGTTWAVEATLAAMGGAAGDELGGSVALAGDGSRALVGATSADAPGALNAGAALVFVRAGTSWTDEASLRHSGLDADDNFGAAVALSANGSRALVGALTDDVGGVIRAGSATVLERSGTAWAETALLTPPGATGGDRFGWSVSTSGDGTRVLVGAYLDDTGGLADTGSASVFTRVGTTWILEWTLRAAAAAAGDNFGHAVALSSDGTRAVVGAPLDDVGAAVDAGSARVFLRTGTGWTEEASLLASGGAAGDRLGSSVAMTADGTRALVGASMDDVAGLSDAGSVRVFRRTASTWSEEAVLLAGGGVAGGSFGVSVAVALDGSRMIAGAPGTASAWVFTRGGTAWSEETSLVASAGLVPSDQFGASVALASDGTRAIVGAPEHRYDFSFFKGSAWAFVRAGTSWAEEARLVAATGTQYDYFGTSVALSADASRAVIGAPGWDVVTGNTGPARAFLRVGTSWTEDVVIRGAATGTDDAFGRAVALTSDGTRVVVGGPDFDASGMINSGTARVFALAADAGTPCLFAADCATGFCVDGMCCQTACAGGTTDCQACSIAAGGSGDGRCLPFASGTVCRLAALACDVAEVCGGTSGACPADGFAPTSTTCRAGVGLCDAAETCTGAGAGCPPDGYASAGTICRTSGGGCDPAELCTGSASSCPADLILPAGTACGGTMPGSCSGPGLCDGASSSCPAATLRPAGTVCQPALAGNACDLDDVCNGTTDVCAAAFAPATTVCAASGGDACDAPDTCAGTSADCVPAYLAGVECRASTGACDPGEMCTGASPSCPGNAVHPAGVSCRASTDLSCDPEETCDGVATGCPADVIACSADAGPRDAGSADADIGDSPDAGAPTAVAGCACRLSRPRTPQRLGRGALILLSIGLVSIQRRRRRSAARASDELGLSLARGCDLGG